jgi:hypothetical protein
MTSNVEFVHLLNIWPFSKENKAKPSTTGPMARPSINVTYTVCNKCISYLTKTQRISVVKFTRFSSGNFNRQVRWHWYVTYFYYIISDFVVGRVAQSV